LLDQGRGLPPLIGVFRETSERVVRDAILTRAVLKDARQ
jgi:hypothetical protein